jgi:hypothetical protein
MRNLAISGLVWLAMLACARGEATYLPEAPAYKWYHGCGPTAMASIIGYYDLHGFDNLFTATGWDDVRLTSSVQDEISSPAHNAKYDPTPDDASLPVPPKTSLACWFNTSVDPIGYGGSYLNRMPAAFKGFVASRGYQCAAWYDYYIPNSPFGWENLVTEIDAGRPMLLTVDSDGDAELDHFVSVFGYDDRGAEGQYYGCYTTWSEDDALVWYQFRYLSSDYAWGVGYGTYVQIVPEPSVLVLLGTAAISGLALAGRLRKAAVPG